VLDFFADLDEDEHQDKKSDGGQDVGGVEHEMCVVDGGVDDVVRGLVDG